MNWDSLRLEHLSSIKHTYLNSPANGLVSTECIAYEHRESAKNAEDPGRYRMHYMFEIAPQIKAAISQQINSHADEIALIQNFSIGINFLMPSIKHLKIGMLDSDYPSLTMPFEQNECTIERFKTETDGSLNISALKDFIANSGIELFALSHVQWLGGYKADIEKIGAICKSNDCYFLVDSTQSFGIESIDVQKSNIDILIASCYKWSLAGFGNGFMYINTEFLSKFKPKVAGFNSMFFTKDGFEYRPSMKSFEPGHHDHNAFNRLHFAVKRMKEIGMSAIQARVVELMDTLIEKLNQNKIEIVGNYPAEHRSAIVAIKSRDGLFKHLLSKGIETSERGGNIRLGLHYYNNEEDIAQLISALNSF